MLSFVLCINNLFLKDGEGLHLFKRLGSVLVSCNLSVFCFSLVYLDILNKRCINIS